MNKQLLMIGITVLSLVVVFSGCIEEKTSGIVIEGKGNYASIQNAIDNAVNNDTILVYNGLYNETLVIDKSINLIGAGDNVTITNYNENKSNQIYIIHITADNCTISGLNIINTDDLLNVVGINIKSSNNVISTNTILNTTQGIHLERDSENNTVYRNNISNNQYGVYIEHTDNNNISKNNISFSSNYGMYVSTSNNNIITNNIISFSDYGIRLKGSRNNKIIKNIITNNQGGLYFCCGARDNIMYYNTFKQNIEWNAHDSLSNQCDNGSVGNYWDDYTEKYPDATEINGTWNIPYNITGGSQDRYPLIKPVDI